MMPAMLSGIGPRPAVMVGKEVLRTLALTRLHGGGHGWRRHATNPSAVAESYGALTPFSLENVY